MHKRFDFCDVAFHLLDHFLIFAELQASIVKLECRRVLLDCLEVLREVEANVRPHLVVLSWIAGMTDFDLCLGVFLTDQLMPRSIKHRVNEKFWKAICHRIRVVIGFHYDEVAKERRARFLIIDGLHH